jgi:hypothetical protein
MHCRSQAIKATEGQQLKHIALSSFRVGELSKIYLRCDCYAADATLLSRWTQSLVPLSVTSEGDVDRRAVHLPNPTLPTIMTNTRATYCTRTHVPWSFP